MVTSVAVEIIIGGTLSVIQQTHIIRTIASLSKQTFGRGHLKSNYGSVCKSWKNVECGVEIAFCVEIGRPWSSLAARKLHLKMDKKASLLAERSARSAVS